MARLVGFPRSCGSICFDPRLSSRLCCSWLSIQGAGERRKRGLEAPRAWAGPDSRGPGKGTAEVTPPQSCLGAGAPPTPPSPLRCPVAVRWRSRGPAAREGGGFLSSAGGPGPNPHDFILSADVLERKCFGSSPFVPESCGVLFGYPQPPNKDLLAWEGGAGTGPMGAAQGF